MKRRIVVVVLLVLICLGLLVVEGVSQQFQSPRSFTSTPSAPASPPISVIGTEAKPNSPTVQPQQQEWTFEQLVEALKGVRARQKELQTQEADILAKLAEKVEEKRQDLSKSEATLKQLRSENGRIYPPKREDLKMEKK